MFFEGVGFLGLLIYAVAVGAVLGAAFRAVEQAALGGRRSFAAVGGTEAERYDVMVDDDVADEARRLTRSPAA